MAILQNYQDACEYSRLQSVLGALSRPRKQPFTSPFSQLDILDIHIMIQIPENILKLPLFGVCSQSLSFPLLEQVGILHLSPVVVIP